MATATKQTIGQELDQLGIPWSMVNRKGEEQFFVYGRNGDYPAESNCNMRVHRIIDGKPICIRERRRYGTTTFTWLEALINGAWLSLGDPWPCINPPLASIREAIAQRS